MSRYRIDPRLVQSLIAAAREPSIGLGTPPAARWAEYMAQLVEKGLLYSGRVSLDEEARRCRAYALVYLPRYLPRLRETLGSAGLFLKGLIRAAGRNLTILDIGCGPGTCAIAALSELNEAARQLETTVRVRVRGRDRRPQLETASDIIRRAEGAGLWDRVTIDWQPETCDMFAPVSDSADLVIFGHSICEQYQRGLRMPLPDLFDRIRGLLISVLSTRGVAVILEPLSVDKSWVPLRLREALGRDGALALLGPCPRQELCPELEIGNGSRGCGAGTEAVQWSLDDAGRDLRNVAVLAGKHLPRVKNEICILYPQQRFFGLVIGRRPRPRTPAGAGTVVARKGPVGTAFACVGNDVSGMRLVRLERPGAIPGVARYEAVMVGTERDVERMTPFHLSALYADGWA